jgi:UrcA family protein
MNRFFLALALLGSAAAAPVCAQDQVTVSFDKASLVTAKGREALDRRVARAVVRVCGSARVPGSILASQPVRACRVAAADTARSQVERAVAQASRPAEVASNEKRR